MPLTCPRCARDMNVHEVRPLNAPAAVEIDHCPQCAGMWFDKGEAAVVCPTVAYLDRRHIEIITTGKKGGGIVKCPRCGSVPYAFAILDLEVDYCGSCGGVWLEQHEYDGKLRKSGPIVKTSASPYRAVERAKNTKEAPCVGCGATAKIRQMYMAAEGLACRSCYATAINRVQERRARGVDDPITGDVIDEFFNALSGHDDEQ